MKTDSVILKYLNNLKIYVYGYLAYVYICAAHACLESYRLVKGLESPGNRVRDSSEPEWWCGRIICILSIMYFNKTLIGQAGSIGGSTRQEVEAE